jgi:hypothetical protein
MVTGAGNPDWLASHAPAANTSAIVQKLVEVGASMVGKTHTDELSRGIFGENAHYGTPINPRAPGRVPGGSSSGSAAAVAGNLVDFALGTDTGGSVRVPASFCGYSPDARAAAVRRRRAAGAELRYGRLARAYATFGDWIDRHNPRFGFEVADTFLRGARFDDPALEAA